MALALPAIISNITTPLLGLIDVAIVGHFGAASYLGAIAVGTTMFNMIYWLFAFLRMGTAGIAAQAHGADNLAEASATLRRGLLMAATFGSLMIALAIPLCSLALRLLHVESEVAPQAQTYFYIAIAGAPAVLGTYVLNGWLLGRQNTRIPMWIALMTNLANTALSLFMVFCLGMRIEGVALGTAISQWLGFSACLIATIRKYRPQKVTFAILLHRHALARLFKINSHIFLRTLCLVAVTMWFTRRGNEFGVTILAANALLMQLFMFFSYFSDGFAFAAEALAGKAVGANDLTSLHTVVKPHSDAASKSQSHSPLHTSSPDHLSSHSSPMCLKSSPPLAHSSHGPWRFHSAAYLHSSTTAYTLGSPTPAPCFSASSSQC